VKKIKEENLSAHSFYFYILPFNDADGEKLSIMNELLGGGCKMRKQKSIKLGDAIFVDIDENPYLKELYDNLLYNYSIELFSLKKEKRNLLILKMH
jgi:hypothetical protein